MCCWETTRGGSPGQQYYSELEFLLYSCYIWNATRSTQTSTHSSKKVNTLKRKVCIMGKKKVDICSPQQMEVLSLFCLPSQTDCRAHLLLGFYQQWSSVHDYGGKNLQQSIYWAYLLAPRTATRLTGKKACGWLPALPLPSWAVWAGDLSQATSFSTHQTEEVAGSMSQSYSED